MAGTRDWVDLLTVGLGLGTFVLLVRGTILDLRRQRPRLKVTPKIAYAVGPIPETRTRLCIEVVNCGSFAVTVDSIGFLSKGTKQRAVISIPEFLDGGKWPRRVEPHESFVAYGQPIETMHVDVCAFICAYAETASGERFLGSSDSVRELVKTGTVPALGRKVSREGSPGVMNVGIHRPVWLQRWR